MTNEEIDALWAHATRESVEAGELYTRYRFAALVRAAEREKCAQVCEDTFYGNAGELNHELASAIRARSDQLEPPNG